jgi:uncharacterized protein YndB with AHSA1/START domain
MTRIASTAVISRPPEVVFDYVTTPGNWPDWHPSSLGVTGATDHSLDVGEQCTEHFRVAGREGYVVWTVANREVPRLWVITGQITTGGGGTITYTLSPVEGGTRFEREFIYPVTNPLLKMLDLLVLQRRIQAESAQAVRQLQSRLETGGEDSR